MKKAFGGILSSLIKRRQVGDRASFRAVCNSLPSYLC